jgi:hypothetical protein
MKLDEALELKGPNDGLGVINLRFAAYCPCSADMSGNRTRRGSVSLRKC